MQILGFLIFLSSKCLRFLMKYYNNNNNASVLRYGCLTNKDLRSGFWVFGCFTEIRNVLLLVLMFFLGFKAIQLGSHYKGLVRFFGDFRGKQSDFKNGFCSVSGSKILSCLVGFCRFYRISSSSIVLSQIFEKNKEVFSNGDVKINDEQEEDDDDDDGNHDVDDDDEGKGMEELRRAIKIERDEKNAALLELEKERMSSTSAANESMAMILRLQNEKYSIEMESNQFRRLAEQKQQYDQEVIQSLEWVLHKHEYETRILENQLNLCKEKLKDYMNVDELEEFDKVLSISTCSTTEDDFGDSVISSLLDMD